VAGVVHRIEAGGLGGAFDDAGDGAGVEAARADAPLVIDAAEGRPLL
jgi:hypothetical protein